MIYQSEHIFSKVNNKVVQWLHFYRVSVGGVMSRADRKSQVRQCLDFCTPDFWSLFAYESAEEKPKHCLTWDFLSALLMSYLVSSVSGAEWRRPPRLSWRPPPCSGGWAAGRRCSSWPETRGITQGSLIDSLKVSISPIFWLLYSWFAGRWGPTTAEQQ